MASIRRMEANSTLRLALHFDGDRRWSEPRRKPQPEALQDGCSRRFRSGDAAESHVATGFEREHDVDTGDAGQLFQDGSRTRSEAGLLLPALQYLPHRVGEEADEDVR